MQTQQIKSIFKLALTVNYKIEEQRMIQQRKPIKTYNQMLHAYESSCIKIKDCYIKQMTQLTSDSVKVLRSLFQSYLIQKGKLIDYCQQVQVMSTQQSSNKNVHISKVFQEDYFQCLTSAKKAKSSDYDKCNNNNNQNFVLSHKMDKLNINNGFLMIDDQEQFQGSNSEESPTKKIPTNKQQLKNKNIVDLIMQSQKKVMNKLENQKQNKNFAKNNFFSQESDSQYEITDYSSNQSSNDGSYSPYYAQQVQNKPLFGGLFSKTMSSDSNNSLVTNSNSNLLNFNLSSKQLLKSPKKLSKSKRSRLYVRAKKIPKWAENLEEVEHVCAAQDVQAKSIFGKCIVENLNTNLIFHGQKQGISRTSSAKWNSQIFLT